MLLIIGVIAGVALATGLALVRLFLPSKWIAGFDRGVEGGFKWIARLGVLAFIGFSALIYFGLVD